MLKSDKTYVLQIFLKSFYFYLRKPVDNVDISVGNSVFQGIFNFFLWINYFFVDNLKILFLCFTGFLQRKFHHFC